MELRNLTKCFVDTKILGNLWKQDSFSGWNLKHLKNILCKVYVSPIFGRKKSKVLFGSNWEKFY